MTKREKKAKKLENRVNRIMAQAAIDRYIIGYTATDIDNLRQEAKELRNQETVCTTMTRCHRRAKKTNDPARPPFCNRCKRKNKRNRGIKRKSRSERRKVKLGTN